MAAADPRIIDVALDERSIVRWNADIDHERRVAIFDLLEQNYFEPVMPLAGGYGGPFRLLLRAEDNRLAVDIANESGDQLHTIVLATTPFRRIIREYFAVCESYFEAIKTASPRQIEAVDVGRRGLHNEGAARLQERLADKVKVDDLTARRLFTLVCVLHLRG